MEATGTGVTATVMLEVTPPAVALTTVVPGAMPVTSPVAENSSDAGDGGCPADGTIGKCPALRVGQRGRQLFCVADNEVGEVPFAMIG